MWLTGLSLLALLGYGLSAWGALAQRERWLPALWLAWGAQALALLVDLGGLGAAEIGVRFGFAPALSLMLWLVLAVVLLESRFLPLRFMRLPLSLLAAATVLLAWLFPGKLHAAAGPWAPLHWVLGLVSYGLFATAVLHAWLLGRAERQMRQLAPGGVGLPLLRLERLTFQFVAAGVLVLGLALVLGFVTLTQWRWDHKTLFSVLAWTVLAGLLAGRHWLGWRGAQALRWLYVGSGLLLLAYVGSRFVLQVVLGRGV